MISHSSDTPLPAWTRRRSSSPSPSSSAGYGAYLGGPGIIGGLAHATALRWALLLPLALVALVWAMAWSTTD